MKQNEEKKGRDGEKKPDKEKTDQQEDKNKP